MNCSESAAGCSLLTPPVSIFVPSRQALETIETEPNPQARSFQHWDLRLPPDASFSVASAACSEICVSGPNKSGLVRLGHADPFSPDFPSHSSTRILVLGFRTRRRGSQLSLA